MKIALIQQHATHDMEDNLNRGVAALREAAAQGADLVVFAELAFHWFWPQRPATPDTLAEAEPIPGPTTERFCALAKELGVVVVINLFERDGDETFDTSPVIDADGTLLGKTRMLHIIETRHFHEEGYYAPGEPPRVYDTACGKLGVAICYDRHFPEYMRSLALKGAEVVVIPQAGAVDEWPPGVFEAELQAAAFQNGYFAALANRVGQEDTLRFAGESFITDPLGAVLARAAQGEDQILYHDLDLQMIENSPARKHFLGDRRPDLYDEF